MINIYQAGQDVIKALSCALDVADKWTYKAFNETSREIVELGKDESSVKENQFKQAKDGWPSNKYCWPDAKSHVEVECSSVEVAKAGIGKLSQFVNKMNNDTSIMMMMTGTAERSGHQSRLVCPVFKETRGYSSHWEETDGDPPNLMPVVDMDKLPGRT